MAGCPSRSVDSTMSLEDDDPTITLGGLANANLEPHLVNQSPIAPLAMKPVLTIDEVTAGQAVSFGALPLFPPSDSGFALGDLRQPKWLALAVLKAEDTTRDARVAVDATKGPSIEVPVEENKMVQLVDWVPLSPSIMQENVRTEKVQPASLSSPPYKLQQTVNTTMTVCGAVTGQAGQLEEGEILTDHELQFTALPSTDAIDLDEQALSPFHLNFVAERLLNDLQFIKRVGRTVFAAQSVPQRQSEHVSGVWARSALVINYSQSLIRYCEVAGLPPPEFRFESNLRGDKTLYRATAIFGRPSVTFKRPIARGQYGNKRQVREDAAQDAWEYLVSSEAIIGTGFFVDQQEPPLTTVPRPDLGGRLLDRYWQSGNPLLVGKPVAPGPGIDSDPENEAEFRSQRPPRRLATASGQRETTRLQGSSKVQNPFRFGRPSSSDVRGPISPPINPARLQMLQHSAPLDYQDMQPTFHPHLGPLNSGANVAPLGRKRLELKTSSSTAGPQQQVATTDPRRMFRSPSALSLGGLPAPQANRPYIPPQKRGRDQFEGNGLVKRQLTEIGRALGPHSTKRAAIKSMTGLVGSLIGMGAPLARVEIICKYVSIQSPQYFEVSRDGERVQWGARMTSNYLNSDGITLGPTVLTWNEVLGKTTCARQFVEPYLMAGIKLHGFGAGQDAQIDRQSEPMSKRQKISDSGIDARNCSTVCDEVEEFVHDMKEEVIKTESVD